MRIKRPKLEPSFPLILSMDNRRIKRMQSTIGKAVFFLCALAALTTIVLAAEYNGSVNYLSGDSSKALDGDDNNENINDNLNDSPLADNLVIFRLDDASAVRSSLAAVREILELFDKTGTHLDVGVIPHETGLDSYKIPLLKPFIQKGLVDLSIHGYEHVTDEFNTSFSNRTEKELSDGLNASLISMEDYFGEKIISFTVPYDAFDEMGFDAVRDAGLKIFSSQKMSEAYPSVEPVDFFGEPDPIHGMMRLPAVISVNLWDSRNGSYNGMLPIGIFRNNIDFGLNDWGVAIITIEPQSFTEKNGSVNETQIHMLGEMINISKKKGQPTTFKRFYAEKLQQAQSPTSPNIGGFKINQTGMDQTINDDSLVLALNLDNCTMIGETSTKAVDESKYHNNGTISGATWTSLGRFNSALQFDGVDDYVDCGNSSTLDITGNITIELWMKPKTKQEVCSIYDSVGNYGVLAKAQASGRLWSWQLRYGSPDNCSLGFQFNETNGNTESRKWVTVKQNLVPGKWYFVAGTFDGNNIKCYLNGILKDTNQMSGIQPSKAKLLVGDDGWHNMFKGTIDQVRIYRRALTSQEIMLRYKQMQ